MREFSPDFQAELFELMKWRRDVRHFLSDPVDADILNQCLSAFSLAPSVGLSEPWRIVQVQSENARAAAFENFQRANNEALSGYSGEDAKLYANLKLSGMQDAPEQFAVFCADDTDKGKGLGAQSMPEMRRYSVVAAIMNFWLAARAVGLGVGWVSVLNPVKLRNDLDVPKSWALVAYLCVGWPALNSETPELEALGWEKRDRRLTNCIVK